jgi:hypothetical protein
MSNDKPTEGGTQVAGRPCEQAPATAPMPASGSDRPHLTQPVRYMHKSLDDETVAQMLKK